MSFFDRDPLAKQDAVNATALLKENPNHGPDGKFASSGEGGSDSGGDKAKYHNTMSKFHDQQASDTEKSDPMTSKYHVLASALHKVAGQMHKEGHAGAAEMSKNADSQTEKAVVPERRAAK